MALSPERRFACAHVRARCGDIPAVMREYFATGINRHCAKALHHQRHAHPGPLRLSRPHIRQTSCHDSACQSAGDAMPVVSRLRLRKGPQKESRTITQSRPRALSWHPQHTAARFFFFPNHFRSHPSLRSQKIRNQFSFTELSPCSFIFDVKYLHGIYIYIYTYIEGVDNKATHPPTHPPTLLPSLTLHPPLVLGPLALKSFSYSAPHRPLSHSLPYAQASASFLRPLGTQKN